MSIRTSYDVTRMFPWQALDEASGKKGYGSTEHAALTDLAVWSKETALFHAATDSNPVCGQIIAEFQDGLDALHFKQQKDDTYTVTAGINLPFAVRKAIPAVEEPKADVVTALRELTHFLTANGYCPPGMQRLLDQADAAIGKAEAP